MKYQTINGWTKESMINHIKTEFKGKSIDKDAFGTCLYRGPNGTKCAVGIFIKDDNEAEKLEGFPVSQLFFNHLQNDFPLNLAAMNDIQMIHDGSHPDTTLQDMLTWVENNVE